jgi:methionyl aminopeptidase
LTLGTGASPGATVASANPPKPAAATGLVDGALEGQDDDEDGDEDNNTGGDLNTGEKPSNGTL